MDKIQILETSEKMFFGKRYTDVKLSSLARSLGIKTPSLYHWFADKQTLLFETVEYSAKKFLLALRGMLEKHDPKAFISWYLTYPSKEKNLFAIAFQK